MSLTRHIPILAMLCVSMGAAPAFAQEAALTTGRSIATLKHVRVKSPNGARILLGSRVKPGKPTLISIWASWCAPCIAEAPYLNQIRKNLGSGYNFLYINRRDGDPDPDQPAAAVARFLARAGMTDIDYVTADDKTYRQIIGADIKNIPNGMVGIPRIYLFDSDGRQIHTAYGFDEPDIAQLERRIKQAMAK